MGDLNNAPESTQERRQVEFSGLQLVILFAFGLAVGFWSQYGPYHVKGETQDRAEVLLGVVFGGLGGLLLGGLSGVLRLRLTGAAISTALAAAFALAVPYAVWPGSSTKSAAGYWSALSFQSELIAGGTAFVFVLSASLFALAGRAKDDSHA